MSKLEMELYSAKQMARQYKTLYEKERAVKNGRVILRDTDKTRLLQIRDFIDELLERWELLD